jgi:cytoskeletal protein CcmA (bactofilin family)
MVIAFPCAAAEDDHRGTLTGSFAEEQFVAGEEVRVEAATVNDLFAAGGEVVFEGLAAEDVIAAGGSLRLRGMVVEDLIAAGGEVEISGEVRDDLIAAAGRLRLGPDSLVGGYALLAGGSLDLEGRIEGNLKAAGGRIRLSGEVTGDVDLSAGRIALAPGARIGGKLTYRSGSEADIAPGAVIGGGVERVKGEVFEVPVLRVIGFAVGSWIVVVLGLTLVGAVLQAAVPALLTEATVTLEARPWASLGLGFALAVATPVAANLLFVTLVGVPTGFRRIARERNNRPSDPVDLPGYVCAWSDRTRSVRRLPGNVHRRVAGTWRLRAAVLADCPGLEAQRKRDRRTLSAAARRPIWRQRVRHMIAAHSRGLAVTRAQPSVRPAPSAGVPSSRAA